MPEMLAHLAVQKIVGEPLVVTQQRKKSFAFSLIPSASGNGFAHFLHRSRLVQ
ncbi:hypothetical protein NR402_16875 [Acidithiobacillus ferrooxidans]|uniref:hypothetical protein n=1 Tax=Acidithiobacillus ferrooxidans TaxID=920 RepID=UPI00214ADC5F|nr:hypothetical protein [Acidithiobacillus ferrooxidans]MCR2831930.1 hypothetical protein [Acidithiobacillus ferrooxidans]